MIRIYKLWAPRRVVYERLKIRKLSQIENKIKLFQQREMPRNHSDELFISRRNQNCLTNGDGANTVDANRKTSPTDYIIHEITIPVTIIGIRPIAKCSNTKAQTIDSVNQRMLLMDKGNSLNNIIEKMQVSMAEQTFLQIQSDDEFSNSARSSSSSSQWLNSNQLFDDGERIFAGKNSQKSSDNDTDDQTNELSQELSDGADAVILMSK